MSSNSIQTPTNTTGQQGNGQNNRTRQNEGPGSQSTFKPRNQKPKILNALKPANNFKNVFTNNFTTHMQQAEQVSLAERKLAAPPPNLTPNFKLKRHIITTIKDQKKFLTHILSKGISSIVKEILDDITVTDKSTPFTNSTAQERIKVEVFHAILLKEFTQSAQLFGSEEDISEEVIKKVFDEMMPKCTEYLVTQLQGDIEDITDLISGLSTTKDLASLKLLLNSFIEAYIENLYTKNPCLGQSLPPPPNPYEISDKLVTMEYEIQEDKSRINLLESKMLILTEQLQKVKGFALNNAQNHEDRKLKIDNIENRSWHNSNIKQKSDLLLDIIGGELGHTIAELSEIEIITPTAGTKYQETWAMITLPNTQAKHNLEQALKKLRNNNEFKCFSRRPNPRLLQAEMKETMDLIRLKTVELYNEAALTQARPDRTLPKEAVEKIAVKPVTRSGNYSAWFEVQCPQSKLAWIPINLDPNAQNPFNNYNFNEDIHNPTVREAAKKNPSYCKPRDTAPISGANNTPIGQKAQTNNGKNTPAHSQVTKINNILAEAMDQNKEPPLDAMHLAMTLPAGPTREAILTIIQEHGVGLTAKTSPNLGAAAPEYI